MLVHLQNSPLSGNIYQPFHRGCHLRPNEQKARNSAFIFGLGWVALLVTMDAIIRRYARGLKWPGLALLFWMWPAGGVRAAELPASRDSEYVITVWQTDDGLPQNEVTSLAQTREGYLWIGLLHGGLARFDGARFTLFTPLSTPELTAIEVLQLVTDARGVLWIGPSDGSLTTWSDGRFTLQRPPQSDGGLGLRSVVSLSSTKSCSPPLTTP